MEYVCMPAAGANICPLTFAIYTCILCFIGPQHFSCRLARKLKISTRTSRMEANFWFYWSCSQMRNWYVLDVIFIFMFIFVNYFDGIMLLSLWSTHHLYRSQTKTLFTLSLSLSPPLPLSLPTAPWERQDEVPQAPECSKRSRLPPEETKDQTGQHSTRWNRWWQPKAHPWTHMDTYTAFPGTYMHTNTHIRMYVGVQGYC